MNVIVSIMRTFAVALVLVLTATGLWAAGADEGSTAAAADKQYVTDPTNGKVVVAPQYGGTITAHGGSGWASGVSDPYVGWAHLTTSGVNEKLGIPNWAIDRDVWDLTAFYAPVTLMIGRLAEGWEQPDPLTYVFNIRKGVHWHNKAPMNGRELTADDVEYNFHRMLGLGKFTEVGPTPFGGAGNLTGIPFESVTATDKWTVVMKLKEPRLAALGIIVGDYFSFIMPPEVIEQYGDVQDWRNLVGTGPFMLTDVVEGSSPALLPSAASERPPQAHPALRICHESVYRPPVTTDRAHPVYIDHPGLSLHPLRPRRCNRRNAG